MAKIEHPRLQWYQDSVTLIKALRHEVTPAKRILDVGCGIMPEPYIEPSELHILAEPGGDYIKVLRDKFGNDPKYLILHGNALSILSTFPDRSVDSVFCLDVVEHLYKSEGLKLVSELDRVAKRQTVIFTPVGFMPQEGDVWGYKEQSLQTHLSGWQPEDFDLNWKILACKVFHTTNGWGEKIDPPCGAMFAVKTKYLPRDITYVWDYNYRRTAELLYSSVSFVIRKLQGVVDR